MESISGVRLRANSAVSASTSCMSLPISKTSSRFHHFPGKRLTSSSSSSPSPSQGSHLPKVIAGVQGISKVNGSKLNGTKVEGSKVSGSTIEVAAEVLKCERKPDGCEKNPAFNAVLMAIATVALAAEKQRRLEELAVKIEVPVDALRQGRLVESGRVYRQTFVIRSYEVGVNKSASIETLMNHFQEAALNHVWMSGLAGDGFGATHAMMRINLIWVVTRMQVQVERYPEWYAIWSGVSFSTTEIASDRMSKYYVVRLYPNSLGEVVEIDTWVMASGKNGMRRDWLLRDYKTGQILARATSTWVMMNRCTRRLSKLPDEVRMEIAPHFLERSALLEKNLQKITKLGGTAEYIRTGLIPRRSDLDMNQHVNNVKYIGWILESLPSPIVEGHDLTSMTLEYRRECGQSDVVQSMTSPESSSTLLDEGLSDTSFCYSPAALALSPEIRNPMPSIGPQEYTHLLILQADGSEIVRGRTVWRIKKQ